MFAVVSLLFFVSSARAQPAPSPNAQAAFTGIRGTLKDVKTGEPLMLAPIKISGGVQREVETDLEGAFEVALPPGTYNLRFWADGYVGKDVVGARVVPGVATRIDMKLELLDAELMAEEVVVEAQIDERKEDTVLMDRKSRATVSDAVSAQEMSRAPDSNAADAVKRVVGATVTRNNTVTLRGLGGRYASTLVNGVSLPSADPDGHQGPIELMPTAMLENLTVHKSYGAEMPGSFAGGALAMETNSYPSSLEVKARLSSGANSTATFSPRHTYRGGSLDFFGIDDGSRRLPASVPRTQGVNSSNAQGLTTAFSDTWTTQRAMAMPQFSLGVTAGNTVPVGTTRLGYVASVGFGHDESARRSRGKSPDVNGTAVTDVASTRGSQVGSMNALLNAGWKLGLNDELGVLSMYSRRGESTAEIAAGDVGGIDPEVATRLSFVERALFFNQVRGVHRLSDGQGGSVRWQANYSHVGANEPDRRDLVYVMRPDGRESFKDGPGSGERFFSTLTDQSFGASTEYRRPVGPVQLSAGVSAQQSVRSFDARRFRYDYTGSSAQDLFLPPEELLSGDSLTRNFALREDTLLSDRYEGSLGVYGGFVSGELKPIEPLRIVAGLRVELGTQSITSGSPFYRGADNTTSSVSRTDPALLPTANAVYALTSSQNLRAGYSFTTVRPQFRELAPVLFRDLVRRRNVTGNPELEPARIHNADLRWEWFPRETEVLAASVFYKQFQNPIEQVVLQTPPALSFRNTPGAYSTGLELEGRIGADRFIPQLVGLRAGANLSLIRSEVQKHPDESVVTGGARPLQGQAPYVVNLNLGYAHEALGLDVAVLYNVIGPTLAEVGSNHLPHAYEQPFHSLDLSASKVVSRNLKVKAAAKNLLNQDVVIEQAGLEAVRYRPGIAGSLALEWAY